ncbi:MAG: hypothetical protein ACERLM_08680 [Acidimicrobiales bacterium]
MHDDRLETTTILFFLTPAVLALLLVACGDSGTATASDEPTTTDAASATTAAPTPTVEVVAAGDDQTACPTEGDEWEVAKLYVEHNATDEDTGVHGLFGGEAWQELCITDPDGNRIFLVDPQAQLHDLAVSDFFFESREPEATEYSVADLRSDFPEGEYTVSGTDYDGVARMGTARFTHAIPTEPEITGPVLAEDAETADESTVPSEGLVVTWEPVTETIDGDPVTITGYEVIVTMEEFEDTDGLSRPVSDVRVPADLTSLAVPVEFLLPDTIYELEVLALEESGNQTISVGFFRTAA